MKELATPSSLNIVLFQPEIPANTGNIGRLCVGTDSALHLIKPFRFLIDDKSLKRAGLDYWHHLRLHIHESWDDFYEKTIGERFWLCTTKTDKLYTAQHFEPGDYLVFGPESRGLPEELLARYPENCITIPMSPQIRSINLSNSVAIVLYEAVRQIESGA